MLSRILAQSLMQIIPEKFTATITLSPDMEAPVIATVFGAWWKPMNVQLSTYGGIQLQGNETRIRIPDHELNANGHRLQIRPNDRITVDGADYNVISSNLMTVRTVWDCLVRKEIC